MTPRLRFARWVALATLLVCGWLVLRETERAGAARDDLAAAMQRRDRLREQLARAQRAAAAMEGGAFEVATAPNAANGARHGGERSAGNLVTISLTESVAVVDPQVALATDAGLRGLRLRVFDDEFEGAWGRLLQRLKLSPEKLAAFKALLRNHEERRLDVTAVAAEQKLEDNDRAIQKMRSDDGLVLHRQMQELLGPEDGKVYQQFRRDRDVQLVLSEIAGRTFFEPTPLTATESWQLQTILAANCERTANGFLRMRTLKWDAALAAIENAGTFSPTVVAVCRQIAAERALDRRADERLDEISSRMVNGDAQRDVWLPQIPPLEPRR